MKSKVVVAGMLVVVIGVMSSASALAAKSDSCPAAASGWTELSVKEAAATIFPDLVDAEGQTPAEFEQFIAEFDVNGNGDVCLATRKQRNERAHFFGSPLFLVKDDNTGVG